MKINKLKGSKEICKFTYVQTMKSKSMKISILIICLIIVLFLPGKSFISGMSLASDDEYNIKKVYINDETNLIGKEIQKIKNNNYKNLKYIISKNKKSEKEFSKEKNSVYLEIKYSKDVIENGISINVYYLSDSNISKSESESFAQFVKNNTKNALLFSFGFSKEEASKIINSGDFSIDLINFDQTSAKEENPLTDFEYGFTYTSIILLIFMVSIAGSKVAELIVTEKSTKVMEYLLTSVKPMAVLFGKVMGSLLIVMVMILSIVLSYVASNIINGVLFNDYGVLTNLDSVTDNLTGLNPFTLIISVLIFILGLLFFCILGGIAGATVSKIEEMAEGMKLYTFALLIGAYASMYMVITAGINGTGFGVFNHVVFLMPLSSVFIVPQYLMLGKIMVLEALLALLILIISIYLLVIFANKIYEHMLYSNGAPLKIKDIIGLAKTKKGGKKSE